MNLAQGIEIVQLARSSVESYFSKKDIVSNIKPKKGVFVTIHTIHEELRGCVGYPYPVFSLGEATIKAAKAAAFSDPRFSPLSKKELDNVLFEVSILTKPEEIKVKSPKEYPSKINIGKDGLTIESDGFSGLLLPQVPLPLKWNAEQFLNGICEKAGLLPDTWREGNCKICKFQAEIFREKTPNGQIIQEKAI